MKSHITLFVLFLFFMSAAQAQVGIGTTTPNSSAMLDVESTTQGFLPPRMSEAERDAIVSPAQGLIIYNTTVLCIQVNDGTPATPDWNCISGGGGAEASTNGTAIVSNYGNATCDAPSEGTITGTMYEGLAVSGVTMSIYANVTQVGTYSLSAVQNGVTFSGGGTFTVTGCQEIILTASGIPTAAGPFTWCTNTMPQGCSSATVAAVFGSFPTGYVHCDPSNPTVVNDVINPRTGKTWMDRNLGASQVATTSQDAASYGDYYQWGRFADGHQCVTSAPTSIKATTAAPNLGNDWDGKFIIEFNGTAPIDWLTPQDDNLWQGVGGVNNPCPIGYRLPTEPELNVERATWTANNSSGAFFSALKFPMAGGRSFSLGQYSGGGTSGSYWTSTVSGTTSWVLSFGSSSASMGSNGYRALALSVRCIKD